MSDIIYVHHICDAEVVAQEAVHVQYEKEHERKSNNHGSETFIFPLRTDSLVS